MESNKNAKNSLTTEFSIQIRRCHRRHFIIIANMYENNKDEIPHFLLISFRRTWIYNVWIETAAKPNGANTHTYHVFPLLTDQTNEK